MIFFLSPLEHNSQRDFFSTFRVPDRLKMVSLSPKTETLSVFPRFGREIEIVFFDAQLSSKHSQTRELNMHKWHTQVHFSFFHFENLHW